MIEVYNQNFDNTWFSIAIDQQQILASSFGVDQSATVKNVLGNISFDCPFQVFHEPTAFAKNAFAILKNIYDGKKVALNLPLAINNLRPYTKKVLRTTLTVPLGYVTSYGAIAKAVGGGPRAVGNIMASNPFAPIVPCHRVVRTNFSLGGYGFGLKTKIELLGREKQGFSSCREIEVLGGRLMVFPVEQVLRNFA